MALDSCFFRFATLPPSRMITSCSNAFPSMVTEPNCVRSILGFILRVTTSRLTTVGGPRIGSSGAARGASGTLDWKPELAVAGTRPSGEGTRGWGARRRLRQTQELSASPAGGSWPVTRRDPALGTKTDSEPESQRTVISRLSTAVTTPLRVTLPTFSDSTSTRSPTSTIVDLLWIVTDQATQVSPPKAAGPIQDARWWQSLWQTGWTTDPI